MSNKRESSFKRFVEVGRVVIVNKGFHTGKLAVIVEIVDHSRAILDGPSTGVPRGIFFYRDLRLTPVIVKIPRGARSKKVRKEFEAQKIQEKWDASSWAKKIAAVQARKNLGDFGRFEVMVLKKRRRDVVNKAVHAAKKSS